MLLVARYVFTHNVASFYCCQKDEKSIALICERVNSAYAEVNATVQYESGI